MSEAYQPYLDWIDSQSQHMAHLVWQWSAINSGSAHIEGLSRMCRALEDNFLWLDGVMERIALPPLVSVDARGQEVAVPVGEALRIRKRPHAPLQIFLGGHMDTVFGPEHPFQKPQFLNENTLNGPGVADLKGGLVVMLKALEALERSPMAQHIGWEVLINPDEEIGSQSSDFLLREAASRCRIGLVYEPALADGTLAGARKGSGNFTIAVHGKAAHAGRDFHAGRNAMVRAAALVARLDALNGAREGVTLNVGAIDGGGPLNMVPDMALVRFNVRLQAAEDAQWVEAELARIIADMQAESPDPITLHGRFTRIPKSMDAANQAVMAMVQSCGQMLGLDIRHQATGGCCDGNNLYAHGLPNVDTLGVRGGNLHSDQEFMFVDSLAERAKLSALLLMRLADGALTV